jgi:pyridoxal phosphate enzyme (YggS family)
VNISGESSKSGVSLEELAPLAEHVLQLPHLQLRGLMAMPAPGLGEAAQRESFARLREALSRLRTRYTGDLDTLSMGMSDDLESAIAEGSTMVRVGSAIFGSRNR